MPKMTDPRRKVSYRGYKMMVAVLLASHARGYRPRYVGGRDLQVATAYWIMDVVAGVAAVVVAEVAGKLGAMKWVNMLRGWYRLNHIFVAMFGDVMAFQT